MFMSKRLMRLLAVFAVFALFTAACGSDAEETTTDDADAAAETDSSDAEEETDADADEAMAEGDDDEAMDEGDSGDAELVIGTILPVTGDLAFLGPAEVAGAELAVADINAAGGVFGTDVVLIQGDSGDTTTDTANVEVDRLLALSLIHI